MPLNVGLIGAGRMGQFHAHTLEHKLTNARLFAVADPVPEAASSLVQDMGSEAHTFTDIESMIELEELDAVVIASPAKTHSANALLAIGHGKAVFCEKPVATSMEDINEIIEALEANPVPFQVGFNRRFETGYKAAHEEVQSGAIGTPQLLRSTTRDPELQGAENKPEWTIFLETLIHDFDTLRYLNPEATPSKVYVAADALIHPELKDQGLLDTAVVTVTFDNGAIATAEANFQAVYGYDVRAEVFGSAGMLTAGDIRTSSMVKYTENGGHFQTSRYDQDLLYDAYVSELKDFVECVRSNETPKATIQDAKWALAMALASIESYKINQPVKLKETVSNLLET